MQAWFGDVMCAASSPAQRRSKFTRMDARIM
jgi:hypothetical protein